MTYPIVHAQSELTSIFQVATALRGPFTTPNTPLLSKDFERVLNEKGMLGWRLGDCANRLCRALSSVLFSQARVMEGTPFPIYHTPAPSVHTVEPFAVTILRRNLLCEALDRCTDDIMAVRRQTDALADVVDMMKHPPAVEEEDHWVPMRALPPFYANPIDHDKAPVPGSTEVVCDMLQKEMEAEGDREFDRQEASASDKRKAEEVPVKKHNTRGKTRRRRRY